MEIHAFLEHSRHSLIITSVAQIIFKGVGLLWVLKSPLGDACGPCGRCTIEARQGAIRGPCCSPQCKSLCGRKALDHSLVSLPLILLLKSWQGTGLVTKQGTGGVTG